MKASETAFGMKIYAIIGAIAIIMFILLISCSTAKYIDTYGKCVNITTEDTHGTTKYVFLTSDSLIFLHRSFKKYLYEIDSSYWVRVHPKHIYTHIKSTPFTKKQRIRADVQLRRL